MSHTEVVWLRENYDGQTDRRKDERKVIPLNQPADAAKLLKYFSNNSTIIKYCISPKDKIRKWRDKLKLT